MRIRLITLLLASGLVLSSHTRAQTQITFFTSMGDFVVEMTDSLTPITSGNFIALTMQHFYDGVIFHRVIYNFVVQGGDPTGTGYGGPGYSIPDEFDSTLSNITGTISMANAGPNTGGSQFFFNLKNNTHLDFNKPPLTSAHPVFGWVVSGWQVVLDIGNVPVNAAYRPLTPVVMDSVRVTYWNPLSVNSLPAGIGKPFIYPNPCTQDSRINIFSKEEAPVNIKVYDELGRQWSSGEIILTSGNNSIALNPLIGADLPKGLYFLVLEQGRQREVVKFVR